MTHAKPHQVTHNQAKSRQSRLQAFFLRLWYDQPQRFPLVFYCLLPFSYLFLFLAFLRRVYYRFNPSRSLSIPVVVVGNVSIGGTGKTPVVIALAQALRDRGVRVGVISRGYGATATVYPMEVKVDSSVNEVGDEALLIVQSVACPVVIDPNRLAAVQYLQEHHNVEIILSDDGLQHYRLARSMEVVVIDGVRGMGNKRCLPAGPLREPLGRLKDVNWIISNGAISNQSLKQSLQHLEKVNVAEVSLQPLQWRQLISGEVKALEPLPWSARDKLLAIAAIGNPQRFFNTLRFMGISATEQAFDDHHAFVADDFDLNSEQILLMTTKDAVKCRAFAKENWWALEVSLQLPPTLIDDIIRLLEK